VAVARLDAPPVLIPAAGATKATARGRSRSVDTARFYSAPDWEVRGVSSTGTLTDLAAGDVNGDGYEDIVVASYGQFRVFEGTAGGLAESPSVTVTIDRV
jgi:hypothetical protein